MARDEVLDPAPGTGEEDTQLGEDIRETREKTLTERIRGRVVDGPEVDRERLQPDERHVHNRLHRSIQNNHPGAKRDRFDIAGNRGGIDGDLVGWGFVRRSRDSGPRFHYDRWSTKTHCARGSVVRSKDGC